MSVFRVVFLGTPEIAAYCLAELAKDEHFKIAGVVSQPDRPSGRKLELKPSQVKELALKLGVPIITPESVNKGDVLAILREWQAEVAVVVAFGQIMGQAFLDLYPHRVVNVHASLLPRWRGAAPIQRAIMAQDKITGVSLQVMVKALDAGDVIGERKIEIGEMDALELHAKMMPQSSDLLRVDLVDYLKGNLTPVPQDPALVTYAHKIQKTESKLDWTKPAAEIAAHIRGMKMGPGSTTQLYGRNLKIHRAAAQPGVAAPGQICSLADGVLVVGTGKGLLEISEIQPESKNKMAVTEFLKGHAAKVGDRLG